MVRSATLMEEFKNGKRLWLLADDLSNEIYLQHYKPTLNHTNMKILTTDQYIPQYLRKFQRNNSKRN